ncbi:MAG: glycoside hydrolase domain-containing protein, partial [Tepidisphaeraceae bacterium]
MWMRLYCAALALATALAPAPGAGAVPAKPVIWAVNDTEKVKRDDLNNPNKAGNSAWDGKTIKIFGARNEIVAFQVIVEAGDKPLNGLTVALPRLDFSGDAAGRAFLIVYKVPEKDPTQYVDRPIQIFSENCLNVTLPTTASWTSMPGKGYSPIDPLGWTPVQLVPENAKVGKGGFPLAVAARQNQAFWIDVHIPKGFSPGIYLGQVTVHWNGGAKAIPVELEVFNFTLPDANSLRAIISFEVDQLETYMGSAEAVPAFHRLAHRHRLELVGGNSVSDVKRDMGRYTGADFAAEKGYEGPGQGVGNVVVPRTFFGVGKIFDTREGAAKDSDQWMTFLAKTLPGKLTFAYLPDEPSPRQFPYIKRICENIHSNPGPGGKLPTLVTHQYTDHLKDAIDIWCSPAGGFRVDMVQHLHTQGKQQWFYNGGRPASGAIIVDAPAADCRMMAWAAFKHDADGYFYWHADHWQHNSQKQGERNQNVWANPVTFDNRGQPNKPKIDQGFINGDGVLFFPGTEKLHPEEDRGIPGPISSIQLANFRRGQQDHIYLT